MEVEIDSGGGGEVSRDGRGGRDKVVKRSQMAGMGRLHVLHLKSVHRHRTSHSLFMLR